MFFNVASAHQVSSYNIFRSPCDVPVPPDLAVSLGYPCIPPERFVCFHWTVVRFENGPELIWFDGITWQYADELAWNAYVDHAAVSPTVSPYRLAGASGGGNQSCDHSLLVDTEDNHVYVVPIALAMSLAQKTGGGSLRLLHKAQRAAYRRSATSAVQPPNRIDAQEVDRCRRDRLAHLQDWLDRNAIQF